MWPVRPRPSSFFRLRSIAAPPPPDPDPPPPVRPLRDRTGARHLPRRPRRGHQVPLGNDEVLSMSKAAEYEVIHGRWAMLAIRHRRAGAGHRHPLVRRRCPLHPRLLPRELHFPRRPAPLAPEGSGLPSFWAVLFFEVVFMGLAEGVPWRHHAPPKRLPLPDEVGVYPGRFDPFKLSEKGDLEKLKLQELKHCRLAMGAFLGCLAQQRTPAWAPSRTSPPTSRTPPTSSSAPPAPSSPSKRNESKRSGSHRARLGEKSDVSGILSIVLARRPCRGCL